MNTQQKHLDDLREIRSMMERSTRFLSLSGLSGICAGAFALLGAGIAWWYLAKHGYYRYATNLLTGEALPANSSYAALERRDLYIFFFMDAAIVLVLSLIAGFYFTYQRAQRQGQKIWDSSSKRLFVNLAIPLVTGGLFILALLEQGLPVLISSTTLIFYGLALLNASKFTRSNGCVGINHI